MIPEGWQRTTLGKIAKITSGGTPNRGKPEYWDGSIPWVTTSEIGNGPISSTGEHISEPGLMNSSAKLFPAGTLLMAMYGQGKTRGKIAQLKIEATTNQACAAILTKTDSDAAFLLQNLTARYDEIRNFSNDGSQKNLSGGLLKALPILLPPAAERERIANVLQSWDRAIETVEALIVNARVQKKALMQSLLTGKKRLPGFAGTWKQQRISEISTRIDRRNDNTQLPVLTISSTSGFVRQDQKYSRFMAGKSVENYIVLRKGEFAYNKGNSKTYEFGCVFDLDELECGLVPHVYVCFRLKDGYSHRFYKALFEADYLAPQLGRLVNTGIRNNGLLNITPAQFLSTSVPVPPVDEQGAVAAVMEIASAQVRAFERQLAALRQEKSALMQQLLTGKRRVKVDQREAA
jgi:type I restriction enzyme S subunit